MYLDEGLPLSESIEKCVEKLEGAYSFVLISILEPDAMYIVKNTGTMVIGVAKDLELKDNVETHQTPKASSSPSSSSEDEEHKKEATTTFPFPVKEESHLFQIVASDTTVFQDYTREYYNIEDKEIIKISLTDKVAKTKLRPVKEERVQVRLPPGVPHYYVMEMLDQPNAVCKALNYGARLDG